MNDDDSFDTSDVAKESVMNDKSWTEEDELRYNSDFEFNKSKLPIYKYRTEIIEAFLEYQILIVVGDTGKETH